MKTRKLKINQGLNVATNISETTYDIPQLFLDSIHTAIEDNSDYDISIANEGYCHPDDVVDIVYTGVYDAQQCANENVAVLISADDSDDIHEIKDVLEDVIADVNVNYPDINLYVVLASDDMDITDLDGVREIDMSKVGIFDEVSLK